MRLEPERSALPRTLALFYLVLAAGGAGLLLVWRETVVGWAHCPLRDLTGIPCPTCGGTHAAVALAELRLGDALRANPLVVVAALLLLIWGAWGLLAFFLPALRRDLVLSPREKRILRVGAIALLAGTWIYQILHLT
jgi:hypothetical protein